MSLRLPAALAATVLALLLLVAPSQRAAAEEGGLAMTSTVTYDVQTVGGSVHVTWDVTVKDNDSATGIGGSSYYANVGLPVLRGASDIQAIDSAGDPLLVETQAPGMRSIDEGATVYFTRGIFFGQTYSFHLSYTLTDTRSEAVLVTPNYAFIPAIASGDSATVIINTPNGEPWARTIDPKDCPQTGNSFVCAAAGTSGTYLAALVEVGQPSAVSTSTFDVALKDKTVNVTLTYFNGEDVAAAHQQALITAALPVIENIYGFDYDGPATIHVSQGGRQSSLGYEGLASCTPSVSCEIVISPVAGDYTLLHELSHMWSNIYSKRWLAEGFAEFVAETAGPRLEAGVIVGSPPERSGQPVELALDDWGDAGMVIGADASVLEIEDAGYTYSLRFLQQLVQQFDIGALQAVNRNIATSGKPADSRRYMDLLEDSTRSNLDGLFQTWVFPGSGRSILADRRIAIDRLAALRSRLVDQGLPDDIATAIQANIRDWDFDAALQKLDDADNGLETYADMLAQLDQLKGNAERAGLVLPGALTDALNRFDFGKVRPAIEQANDAIAAYTSARQTVGASRNVWERFGLIGSDPDGALASAANSFANGDFDLSRQHSQHASDLVNDASAVAFRRLLVVAGFLSLLVLAIAIAIVVGRFRERELAER